MQTLAKNQSLPDWNEMRYLVETVLRNLNINGAAIPRKHPGKDKTLFD